jgi:hypothetical protein
MNSSSSKHSPLVLAVIAAACLSIPAHAQVFTGTDSDDYGTAGNWSGNAVPVLSNGATAIINNGDAVTYSPGGDFIVSNGGELEISNGSWIQNTGNAWIQMGEQGSGSGTGNGTILVNGGTFDMGTDSNTPFQVTGTGNVFTITSGTANFLNEKIAPQGTGMTFNFDGGNVNVLNEIDYDSNSGSLVIDGSTITTPLVTAVNTGNIGVLDLQAGLLNLTGAGIYSPSATAPVNFTTDSTAAINFETQSVSTVQGWVNSGVITYAGAINPSDLIVSSADGGNGAIVEAVSESAVPEPSTYMMLGAGMALLVIVVRRRRACA